MQKLALLHGSLVLVLVGRTHCAEILSLNGFDWKLSRLCCGPVVVVPNATVPGGVWDNLHRAGRIGNPLYRDNDVVFANATTMPVGTRWVFAKQFGIPATGEVAAAASGNGKGTVLLELAGIQTLANVTVNGQWLINTYNMFRTWRVEVPVGLLNPHPGTNLLEVQLSTTTLETTATPQPPGFTNAPNLRDESDAWGWDWSPNLNPMAISKSVRLVAMAAGGVPYIASFSPKVSVSATDPATAEPRAFTVNVSLELIVPASTAPTIGSVDLSGDWGETSTARVKLPPSATSATVTVHAVLAAAVPAVKLWWPVHYGEPHLHTLTARWSSSTPPPTHTSTGEVMTKRLGFRSVGLYTGPASPRQPSRVDPANTEAFVGCFRDGNPWWGGAQHALPFLASGPDTTMTVSSCIALCAKAGSNYTLAGVQKGGWCYCGTEIGQTCEGCLRGTGTPADPSECGWPCDGNPSVACGGATYMWNSNSVYNVTHASATVSAAGRIPPPPPPPGAEGSGNSGFAVVINGVKIFSRGGNLVPFELLESTVDPNYIKRTVKSAVDGNMNMIRIWGGGIYQADSFYEACDEAGLMLFHDMMFSFRLYPHDSAFEANVAAEVDYQVTRLLHHPSIVLWDSSNENEGDPAFFYRIVLDRIAAIDTNRPLWPASPSSGFSAGVHTDTGLPNGTPLVGRYQQTLDTHMPYGYCSAAFMTSTTLSQTLNPSQPGNPMVYFKSEFGQVSLPAFETLAPVLSETDGDYGIFSDIMVHRKHSTQKDLADPITSLFGFDNFKDTSAANFRRVIFLSQLAQMLCIKTTLEELRRGDETFGALMWQLNDVWQASSWGSLDYGGRWRALQHSLQAVFAPTLVSLWLDHASGTAQVYGSHHGAVESGLAVEVNVTSIVTGKVSSHVLKNWPAPGTAFVAPVGQVPLDTISMKHEVIVTQLIKDGVPVETSLTVHPLLPPTEMDWSIASISDVTTTVSSDLTVVVENGATAPLFYTLVTSTLPGRFSRNLLFIPPKESVHLVFYFANESGAVPTPTPAELRASLSMDWYNSM